MMPHSLKFGAVPILYPEYGRLANTEGHGNGLPLLMLPLVVSSAAASLISSQFG